MIRRALFVTAALVVFGGATTALADAVSDRNATATGNIVCVGTSAGGSNPHSGVCVWFPLP